MLNSIFEELIREKSIAEVAKQFESDIAEEVLEVNDDDYDPANFNNVPSMTTDRTDTVDEDIAMLEAD